MKRMTFEDELRAHYRRKRKERLEEIAFRAGVVALCIFAAVVVIVAVAWTGIMMENERAELLRITNP